MNNLSEYIIEKLKLNKDISFPIELKYKKGDACLFLIHFHDLEKSDINECILIIVVKIIKINEKDNGIITRSWSLKDNDWYDGGDLKETKYDYNFNYLYHLDKTCDTMIIPKDDSLDILEDIKKYKEIDFYSFIGKKSAKIMVSQDTQNLISDEYIDKIKRVILDENNK